jgi:site-specific recombinase XerD
MQRCARYSELSSTSVPNGFAGLRSDLLSQSQRKRLSARAIDLIIRHIGADAHLELSASVLRHTCLTNLVRRGNDLVLVAEIAGDKRLETTRRNSLPSADGRQEAMEGLRMDY